MSSVVEEILSYYSGDIEDIDDDILMHYGMPRRSGRYPWGSGENPYQHNEDFISRVERLRKQNFEFTDENGKTWKGDTAIAKSMGLSTGEFRTELGLVKSERRMLQVARVKSLKEDGLNATEIGREMGIRESTVRSLLDTKSEDRMLKAKATADFLRDQVETKGMIDVGAGVERELHISKEKLDQALYILKKEGYLVYGNSFDQVTNAGKRTTQKVLCPPGTEHKEIYVLENIHTINDYTSHDGGETFDKFVYPKSMDSKRLMIRYSEEGGLEKDGIIELRRGVQDISLGEDHYAQVRILVDGKSYMKGMAVYSDDMPPGVDVIFNTNKKTGTPMEKVLKDIKEDPDNPFGALIKPGGQSYYTDENGNRQLSLINKTRAEGDWTEWKDALPSQFLGKQSKALAQKQLNLAKADKLAEYDDICSLTNPTIKKYYLQKFADSCDSAAVHLKAAALPGQKYHVIIPVNSLKDNEVYAPGYESGTELALIRYPHGGTFEIPILKVNNKNPNARKLIGEQSIDAIGINKNIADRLSGADFDGDTVMCIPTNDRGGKVKITSTPELPGLKGFDPKETYGADKVIKDADGTEHLFRNGREYRRMSNTGTEMGKISNLITDMTLGGASPEKLARAVRHSMVVIDAEKHKLDYKQSELDNNIKALEQEYQPKIDKNGNPDYGGAATILSRAKGQTSVLKRQGTPKVNIKGKEWYDPSKPEGSLIYKTADDLYYPVRSKYDKTTGDVTYTTSDGKKVTYNLKDKNAVEKYSPVKFVDKDTGEVSYKSKDGSITYKTKARTQGSTKMAETDDANTLVSEARHPMELIYADYANSMKALANKARIEMINTGTLKSSKTARETYKNEVDSLNAKLNEALLNQTKERAAQRMANIAVKAKTDANPDMKTKDVKKASQQALTKARSEVGSVSRRERSIKITDREWEAIQAGAISENKLKQILNNSDPDVLRQKAMPKSTTTISQAKINKIKAMSNSNYTLSEIAKALDLPTSTISNYLKG